MRRTACGLVTVLMLATAALAQDASRPSGETGESAPAQSPVSPQTPAPGPAPASKRLAVTAGFDFLSAYMFRGIRQEDSGVIVPPFVDVGFTAYEGDGALSSVTLNGGNWNSLHSGPTGNGGNGNAWYEADYYGSVTLAFGRWKPGALYTSYTSPNDAFGTVQELAAVLAYDDSGSAFPLSPKATIAFELDGQADGGLHQGTYLELGMRPVLPLAGGDRYPLTLAIPTKLGMSLNDYYEGPTGSNTFGFFSTGALASVPLAFMNGRTSWEVHGGLDVLWLGDNLKALNNDDRVKPVAIVGVSVTY
ncbi:MAG TPA: hypothetical protein VD833_16005 [Vicinamibacterales bacterium]|nr:hypothetical protein [Vicinamibacterales bacterium]